MTPTMIVESPRPPLRGLYAITPDLAHSAELLARVEAVLAGGVRWVQYRNKTASSGLRLEQARALRAACRRAGAALIINDDVDLVEAVDADGVHVGGEDGDPATVRARLGASRIIGVSCYDSLARARRAKAACADYVAFGAVYPSPTKPGAVRAPLRLLGEARRKVGLPVAAIGGITLAGAPAVIASGGDLLAVITDLFETTDGDRLAAITAQAQAYQRLFVQGTTT